MVTQDIIGLDYYLCSKTIDTYIMYEDIIVYNESFFQSSTLHNIFIYSLTPPLYLVNNTFNTLDSSMVIKYLFEFFYTKKILDEQIITPEEAYNIKLELSNIVIDIDALEYSKLTDISNISYIRDVFFSILDNTFKNILTSDYVFLGWVDSPTSIQSSTLYDFKILNITQKWKNDNVQ